MDGFVLAQIGIPYPTRKYNDNTSPMALHRFDSDGGCTSKPNKMQSIYTIQLHALLMDCILHAKHGQHTSRNAAQFKAQFCRMIGISPRTSSKNMIEILRGIYEDNNMIEKFNSTIAKFN